MAPQGMQPGVRLCSVPATVFGALTLTEQLSTVPCGKPAHSILLLICTG